MRRTRAVIGALVLGVGLGACSSDDPARRAAPVSTESTSSEPSASPTPTPSVSASATPAATASTAATIATAKPTTAAPAPSPRRTATRSTAPVPPWTGSSSRLDAATRSRMTYSYRAGCPVGLDDLRILRVDHWDFAGARARGELVVHADVAASMMRVVEAMWKARFPIRRMRLIDDYGGDDDRSMAADNSSAFNCRYVKGTTRWSEHSYGRAFDINPIENPYVYRSGEADPPAGQPYVNRSRQAKGMIHASDAVVDAFAVVGWRWGGYWTGAKDYQHFSRSGR